MLTTTNTPHTYCSKSSPCTNISHAILSVLPTSIIIVPLQISHFNVDIGLTNYIQLQRSYLRCVILKVTSRIFGFNIKHSHTAESLSSSSTE